jgi:hypothetical protein
MVYAWALTLLVICSILFYALATHMIKQGESYNQTEKEK